MLAVGCGGRFQWLGVIRHFARTRCALGSVGKYSGKVGNSRAENCTNDKVIPLYVGANVKSERNFTVA